MKKIILASIVAMSFFATEAQTTKAKHKKAKKHYVSPEAKAKAREKAEIARIKIQTDKKIIDYKMASFQADSLGLDSERVAHENFEMQRKAYLENKYKEIDSSNQASYKKMGEDKEVYSKTERTLDAVNKAANLNTYQSTQVKAINQIYFDRAKIVKENTVLTEEQRKEQLLTLNMERRTKLKTILGSAKEKKLEKERKEYAKKYGEDSQAKWINELDGFAKNK